MSPDVPKTCSKQPWSRTGNRWPRRVTKAGGTSMSLVHGPGRGGLGPIGGGGGRSTRSGAFRHPKVAPACAGGKVHKVSGLSPPDGGTGLRREDGAGRCHRTKQHNGSVLLTISTTTVPATDLGYLLHKHPGRAQSNKSSVGVAHVFYPEATEE